MLAFALPVQADSVTDWNALASGPVVAPRFGGPQQQARIMAITSIAVHDALTASTVATTPTTSCPTRLGRIAQCRRRGGRAHHAAGDDRGVAAGRAAEDVNRALAIQAIEAAYAAAIGPGAPDAAEAAGIAAGEAAADEILAQRYAATATGLVPIDGSGTPNSPPYALPPGLGVHQPTPAPEFPQ